MQLPGAVIPDKWWMCIQGFYSASKAIKTNNVLRSLSNFLHIEIISATWKAFEFNLILIFQ